MDPAPPGQGFPGCLGQTVQWRERLTVSTPRSSGLLIRPQEETDLTSRRRPPRGWERTWGQRAGKLQGAAEPGAPPHPTCVPGQMEPTEHGGERPPVRRGACPAEVGPIPASCLLPSRSHLGSGWGEGAAGLAGRMEDKAWSSPRLPWNPLPCPRGACRHLGPPAVLFWVRVFVWPFSMRTPRSAPVPCLRPWCPGPLCYQSPL